MGAILGNDDLVAMLREMIKGRVASDRLWSLQRQGRIGTIAPCDGQEAAIVGASWALEPQYDWVLPSYREPFCLGRYGTEVLDRFAAWALGHPAGGHIPEPIRVLPTQIALATHCLHAVGMAWAMQVKREPGVAMVCFGDGATSEGDFYEAGNLAGVLKAPLIMLCANNQWAISTPVSKQTAAVDIATKAQAFGMPGVKVDGTDPVAVHAAVAEARERAIAGDGPTLIEAVCYRLSPHTTADDPTRYVPDGELEAAKERDPIETFRRELESRGLWDQNSQDAAEKAGLAAVDHAWEWATSLPLSQHELFDNVYAAAPPRLAAQRGRFLAERGEA